MERPKCKNDHCDHLAKPSKKYKSGFVPLCSSCEQKKYGTWERRKSKPYQKRRSKEERTRRNGISSKLSLGFPLVCQDCGFVPVVPDQIDLHHVDCDHSNNEPSNLRLLCANCHRLVHALERDMASIP